MSPLPVHPRHRFPEEVSYSELSTLASCEEKWRRLYMEADLEAQPTTAMKLGTIMGELCDSWWLTGDWIGRYSELVIANEEEDTEPWVTARWLMDRYAQVYGDELERTTVVHSELELKAPLYDAMGRTLVGHVDQLWETPSGLWLVERKTMRDWRNVDYLVNYSVQPSLYMHLAQANDLLVKGVILDCLRTYRWKRDEHVPAESVQMHFTDRTEEQLQGSLRWAHAVLARRDALVFNETSAVRNLGPTCNGCIAQADCWDALAFPFDNVEIVDE